MRAWSWMVLAAMIGLLIALLGDSISANIARIRREVVLPLRRRFPSLRETSLYRPGAIVQTGPHAGIRSKHATAQAVDMAPPLDLAIEWAVRNLPPRYQIVVKPDHIHIEDDPDGAARARVVEIG